MYTDCLKYNYLRKFSWKASDVGILVHQENTVAESRVAESRRWD